MPCRFAENVEHDHHTITRSVAAGANQTAIVLTYSRCQGNMLAWSTSWRLACASCRCAASCLGEAGRGNLGIRALAEGVTGQIIFVRLHSRLGAVGPHAHCLLRFCCLLLQLQPRCRHLQMRQPASCQCPIAQAV